MDYLNVPIVISVRDRLSDLLAQLVWLEKAAHQRIVLLDNDSTYPPLVEFLETCPYDVRFLGDNVGSRAPWLVETAERGEWWVYTDCDVVPTDDCPLDLVDHLHHLLRRHEGYPKAGVGLYTRDVEFRDKYRENLFHAAHRWLGDCYEAPVETTFALYRPRVPFDFKAVRSAHPYEARHLPWYREQAPTNEDSYYLARARASGLDSQGKATGGSDWAAALYGSSHVGDRRPGSDGG